MGQRGLSERVHPQLNMLTLLRALLDDAVVRALNEVLALQEGSCEYASTCAELAYAIFETEEQTLRGHVLQAAIDDENAYVRAVLARRVPKPSLTQALEQDLRLLEAACSALEHSPVPLDLGDKVDFVDAYRTRLAHLDRLGFGIYARHHMFLLSDDGHIVAVRHPDPIRLSDLVGYEREKALIIDNTRALLAGLPAANMLLTGDAGTGKSSTVKAVVNELADEGLRILEVRKSQLHLIPTLLDELTENPLKFILFIDDLSFQDDDDNYAALKAVLEGSVAAKSSNVAVYATSNRRHLVRERFSDREGDEVHINDTLQEIVSLSDRFGIRVSFSRPDKATYLDIVAALAKAEGIEMDTTELELAAERFATRRGGRTARGARQFVDSLLAH